MPVLVAIYTILLVAFLVVLILIVADEVWTEKHFQKEHKNWTEKYHQEKHKRSAA